MTSKPFWPVTGGNYVLLNAEGKNALTLVDIDGEPTLDCCELRLELNQQVCPRSPLPSTQTADDARTPH